MRSLFRILLITNRDSDNIGDQVIEASDIGLIKTVMKNLNISEDSYQIISRAASIISQKYLATKNEKLLETARRVIQKCDVVIFGGAPMFNFLYQNFYERTAITIELAKEYDKPVIFSAIGIEGYDENNARCQRLKKTLNYDCVKTITTRDDFESLKKYKENENLVIDKVSDPAVFCGQIFKRFIAKKKNGKKKVGLFVLRANGFKDNKIEFSANQSAKMWVELAKKLEITGYDYEFITSGHFSDEAFMDELIRTYNIPSDKCVFNMNLPERLIRKISSYDAVVSCRLHPSIISFSLGVPSVGLVWNNKVTGFYESIGYENRVVKMQNVNVDGIVEKIENAITEGVEKDEAYLHSVYKYLYESIKSILDINENIQMYTYNEVMNELPLYEKTTNKQKEEKLKRKFRRIYKEYNKLVKQNEQLKENIPDPVKKVLKKLK